MSDYENGNLLEQPGEIWDSLGAITVDGTFVAATADMYFDAENASYANLVGAKWDKLIVIPQVTAGQTDYQDLEVAVAQSDNTIADNTDFSTRKTRTVQRCSQLTGTAASQLVQARCPFALDLPAPGRYIGFRRAASSGDTANDLTATIKARRYALTIPAINNVSNG